MDQIDKVTLHYAMLEYLFNNHKLAASCFGYAWEDFIQDKDEYSHMTATELKTIFWTEIATNITDYKLLSAEQKEYFNPDDFPLETDYEELQSMLEHNEPKVGVDFTFYRSTSAYGSHNNQTIRQQTDAEMMETIKKSFANPLLYNSVFDDELTGVDEEDTRINVVAQKPETKIDMGEHPLEIFKDFLLTNEDIAAGIEELSFEDVLARLADDDFDIDFDDLPEGLQHYASKLGDTVLKKAQEPNVNPPQAVTSTPIVHKDFQSPVRFTRSQSMGSEISKIRHILDSNKNKSSPRRSTPRRARNDLHVTSSDSAIGKKKA